MAQHKGLIYRLTMGKDNLPDFTPDRLPGSRWAVFKDVFFNRFGAMVKISLLTMIFMIPAFVWLFLMSTVKNYDATIVPYSGNLGLGFQVVEDATYLARGRLLAYNMQTYSVFIPLLMIAGVGFSGAFQVMKLLCWGEGVSVASNFFGGIKRNWSSFLWIFLFAGVSFFVLQFNIGTFNYSDMNGFLRIFMLVLSILQFVMVMSMMIFLTTQAVTYKLGFWGLLKNSFLFAVALFPQNLFFLVLSALPFVILSFIPIVISMFLWILFAFIAVAYVVIIWTIYSQWVYDKFVNDRVKGAQKNRGMYVKDPEEEKRREIERIKARNTSYGAAYVSRRLSSIDNGKSFTPLETNFSRADLERLKEEKDEMRAQIEEEIASVNEQIEAEQQAYEEEQRLAGKRKKKKNASAAPAKARPAADETAAREAAAHEESTPSDETTADETVEKTGKKSKKKKDSTSEIGILPVSEEEYVEDEVIETNLGGRLVPAGRAGKRAAGKNGKNKKKKRR